MQNVCWKKLQASIHKLDLHPQIESKLGVSSNKRSAFLLIRAFANARSIENELVVYEAPDHKLRQTHICNLVLIALFNALEHVDEALKLFEEMLLSRN